MDGSAPVCSSPHSQPLETRYVAEQFVACEDENYVVYYVTLWPGSIDISFSAVIISVCWRRPPGGATNAAFACERRDVAQCKIKTPFNTKQFNTNIIIHS